VEVENRQAHLSNYLNIMVIVKYEQKGLWYCFTSVQYYLAVSCSQSRLIIACNRTKNKEAILNPHHFSRQHHQSSTTIISSNNPSTESDGVSPLVDCCLFPFECGYGNVNR
jgi:hypothetical protein